MLLKKQIEFNDEFQKFFIYKLLSIVLISSTCKEFILASTWIINIEHTYKKSAIYDSWKVIKTHTFSSIQHFSIICKYLKTQICLRYFSSIFLKAKRNFRLPLKKKKLSLKEMHSPWSVNRIIAVQNFRSMLKILVFYTIFYITAK